MSICSNVTKSKCQHVLMSLSLNVNNSKCEHDLMSIMSICLNVNMA